MNRKVIVLLITILIVIAGLAVFYYTQVRQQPKISNTLSTRSQEFIKKQQRTTDTDLKFINLTGPAGEDTRGKRIGRENCYSFIMPYRVTISKFEDTSGNTCSARFNFDNPKGAIFAYMYKKPVASWDDVSGVSFRRSKTDEYEEEMKTFNGKNFLLFRTKGDLYEKSAFYYTPNYFFVFNLLTKTNENLDKDFEKMLESLELEEK
jgi:hypothetical protein